MHSTDRSSATTDVRITDYSLSNFSNSRANSDEELTEKTGILNRVGRWAYYLKPYRSVVINGDYSESPDKLSHIFSGVESTLVCLTKVWMFFSNYCETLCLTKSFFSLVIIAWTCGQE